MIKRLSILLLALLAWGTPAAAQVLDVGSITANSSGGGCTGTANSCASFSLANGAISSVTLAVSGTFTGTLTFEGTSDNSTWFTLSGTKLSDGSSATTTTATGQFSFNNSGLLGVRARATAAMTGTAVVTAARGYAVARWLTPFLSAAYVTGNIQLTSSGQVGWTASATDPTAALDTILCRGAANVIGIGGCTSSFPAIKRIGSTSTLGVVVGDTSSYAPIDVLDYKVRGTLLASGTAPTISAGFGTSPTIPNNNGTAAFTVNVGTGGTASSGTVGLPTATTGWVCSAFDFTSPTTGGGYYVKQTGGTTTTAVLTGFNTAGVATAWTASDVLRVSCFAY
jgi:hypothetical protein